MDNTAYIIAGRENAEGFVNELLAQGLELRVFYTPGRIRENITVHTPGRAETRVSLDNFSVSPEALNALEEEMLKVCCEGDIVVFNGRLPKGVDSSRALTFLAGLKERGACLAVDCNSFSAAELAGLRLGYKAQRAGGGGRAVGRRTCARRRPKGLGAGRQRDFEPGRARVYMRLTEAANGWAPKLSALSTVGAGTACWPVYKGFAAAKARKMPCRGCGLWQRRGFAAGHAAAAARRRRKAAAKIEVDRL